MPGHDILQAAAGAGTAADAEAVQKMISEAVGARYARPLGDKPNNGGLIKAVGGELERPGGKA